MHYLFDSDDKDDVSRSFNNEIGMKKICTEKIRSTKRTNINTSTNASIDDHRDHNPKDDFLPFDGYEDSKQKEQKNKIETNDSGNNEGEYEYEGWNYCCSNYRIGDDHIIEIATPSPVKYSRAPIESPTQKINDTNNGRSSTISSTIVIETEPYVEENCKMKNPFLENKPLLLAAAIFTLLLIGSGALIFFYINGQNNGNSDSIFTSSINEGDGGIVNIDPASLPSDTSSKSLEKVVRIFVTGDIPYHEDELETLRYQLHSEVDYSSLDFGVFLGNFQKPGTTCKEENYYNLWEMLQNSLVPMFVIPGNADWYDCDFESMSNEWYEMWHYYFYYEGIGYEKQFWSTDKLFTDYGVQVNRQVNKVHTRESNFCFEHGGVVFIGVNLVGIYQSKIHSEREWLARLTDNAEFAVDCLNDLARDKFSVRAVAILAHARPDPVESFIHFFKPTVETINGLSLPSIYIHSDGLDFDYDDGQKMNDLYGAYRMQSLQINKGSDAPPLLITFDGLNGNDHFIIDQQGGSYQKS